MEISSNGTFVEPKESLQNFPDFRKGKRIFQKQCPFSDTTPTLSDNSYPLGNCLNCGKIAWSDADDYEKCTFCSTPIWKLNQAAMSGQHDKEDSQELKNAKQRTADLLRFQENWAERTHVYDDANDWFCEANNIWLPEEGRKQALIFAEENARKNESSEKRYAHIDLRSLVITEYTVAINSHRTTLDPMISGTSVLSPAQGKASVSSSCSQSPVKKAFSALGPAPLRPDLYKIYHAIQSNLTLEPAS